MGRLTGSNTAALRRETTNKNPFPEVTQHRVTSGRPLRLDIPFTCLFVCRSIQDLASKCDGRFVWRIPLTLFVHRDVFWPFLYHVESPTDRFSITTIIVSTHLYTLKHLFIHHASFNPPDSSPVGRLDLGKACRGGGTSSFVLHPGLGA